MDKIKKRVLPDLVGKLVDDAAGELSDFSYDYDTSIEKYKKIVLDDLMHLLNTNITVDDYELEEFPNVKNSVLAYGMRSIAGLTINDRNKRVIADEIKFAISRFERRIDPSSINVEVVQDSDAGAGLAGHKLKIKISGELLPLQMAEKIMLKTEIDIETGNFELITEKE